MRLRATAISHIDGTSAQRREFNATTYVVSQAYDLHRPPLETKGTDKVDIAVWDQVPDERPEFPALEPDGRDGDTVDEMNVAYPMSTFLALPEEGRRPALLDLLHGSLMRLADTRGWDKAPLVAAYEATLASDIEPTWTSKPKTSPNRARRATVHGRIDETGAWVRVAINDKAGNVLIETPEQLLDMPEINEIKLRAHTIRWEGNDRVIVLSRPYRGLDEPAYPPLVVGVPTELRQVK